MRAAFLVDAVRSPFGGRGGALSGWHPADLVAELLRTLAARTGLDPASVDDVLLGCAMPVGNQAFNLARSAVLAAGWPETVPGGTVDRQGVGSLATVVDAARAVASGACELVVAGGVEVMSSTPAGATLVPGAVPFGPGVASRYRDRGGLVPAAGAAEALGTALGLDRSGLDDIARRSHERALAGAHPEVVPMAGCRYDRDRGEVVRSGTDVATDELPRPLGADELAAARPAFSPDGDVTALNAAPAADGAAVVLVASEAAVATLHRSPLAVVRGGRIVGADPLGLADGALAATARVLAGALVAAADVARAEVAEPFAAVVAHVERAAGMDPAVVNPAGGGLARGEPTGATGAALVAALAHGLAGRWGVAAAGGGGLGAAVLLERAS